MEYLVMKWERMEGQGEGKSLKEKEGRIEEKEGWKAAKIAEYRLPTEKWATLREGEKSDWAKYDKEPSGMNPDLVSPRSLPIAPC